MKSLAVCTDTGSYPLHDLVGVSSAIPGLRIDSQDDEIQ